MTCPAAGTFVAYNQLNGSKILTHEINLGHNHAQYSNIYPGLISRYLNSNAQSIFDIGYHINIGKDKIVPKGKIVSLKGIVENDDDDVYFRIYL